MEHFAKKVNGFQSFSIFTNRSILDILQSSEYIFDISIALSNPDGWIIEIYGKILHEI